MNDRGALRWIFLGGAGEIGKNMSAVECEGQILVIDAGLKFPENDMYGIDIVIPDYSYLAENRDRIVGMVFTHGHEDHIGGLPYFLQEVEPPPMWGTKLTLGLVRAKLAEWDGVPSLDLREVKSGDRVEIGCFGVEFIHVNHSIPDSCGLAITTPAGVVVHSGDFKFDPTPVDGRMLDAARFAHYGSQGVLLLISDCTNVEKPGYVLSERVVGESFQRIFASAPGRVIVTTFASNIHRIQQVFDVSRQYDRRVCLDGRSMVNNATVARKLGYLRYSDEAQIDIEGVDDWDPEEVTILTTGSQGEPMSSLARMATDEHKKLSVRSGDTVIISATPIPGNEALIWRTVNNLFRRGARVVYSQIDQVHVSGHGNQEEIKLLLSMVRPRYLAPFHGEPRHQHMYQTLAASLGYTSDRIFSLEPYDILEVGPEGASVVGRVPGEVILVDGEGVGDIGSAVLRERQALSEDGVVFVSAVIDWAQRRVVGSPAIDSRGFVYVREAEHLLADATALATRAIETDLEDNTEDAEEIQTRLRRVLLRFFRDRTGRRPIVTARIFLLNQQSAISNQPFDLAQGPEPAEGPSALNPQHPGSVTREAIGRYAHGTEP